MNNNEVAQDMLGYLVQEYQDARMEGIRLNISYMISMAEHDIAMRQFDRALLAARMAMPTLKPEHRLTVIDTCQP